VELTAAARRLGLAGAAEEGAAALVDWICAIQRDTGVPTRLRDLGIEREALRPAAVKTMHERGLAYNPRAVADAAEIESILYAAW
jgi:alcohol dehydrogenase class IV